jgi:hypothetical protein
MMQEIELEWLPPLGDLSTTELLISKFQSLITPSSCPVATRQQLGKKHMQDSSELSGDSSTFIVPSSLSIFFESQSLIVLSKEQVMTFGLSLI